VISRSLVGTAEHVTIKGLNFFSGTFDITGPNLTIEDSRFSFPDASKRMLGIYAADSDAAMQDYGSLVNGANFTMRNTVYEYAEMGIVLEKPDSLSGTFENNLFQYVSIYGMGKNSLVQFAPTFTRNTVRHSSPRGLFKSTIDGDSSLRDQSLLLIAKSIHADVVQRIRQRKTQLAKAYRGDSLKIIINYFYI
tara:strand:+ start:3047 stop:3625 length:579 start_codon:yes stop_codon:yes gene_type:complete